jgi:hypothetical protein
MRRHARRTRWKNLWFDVWTNLTSFLF